MKQLTILHLVHRLGFGGTERVVVNLLNHAGDQYRNLICSFFPCDEEFLKEIHANVDSVFHLGKKPGNDLSMPFKISELCRKRHVDIIHSLGWGTYAEGIAAARLLGKRYAFIHSFRGMTQEDLMGIPRRRLLAEKAFSRFCDAIICPSELSRRQYGEMIGIDPKNITVIYNGVDIHRFASAVNVGNESLKNEFRLKKSDFVIGYVGRIDPVKNLESLLKAFSAFLPISKKTCMLLLIGDGSDFNSIKSMVESLALTANVVMPGIRRDVPECLRLMDLFVLPSRYEGVPNSVLEAMATGVPVICTNVGGLAEIIQDGESGLLVQGDSENDLANAIRQLFINREQRLLLAKKARDRVVSLFSIESMVANYERLYERLIER